MCVASIVTYGENGYYIMMLPGEYFTAVDLAKFATELDEAEKIRMAEGGFESTEFLKFMAQPSSNMDDSGYFSVQVCFVCFLLCLHLTR